MAAGGWGRWNGPPQLRTQQNVLLFSEQEVGPSKSPAVSGGPASYRFVTFL